MGKSQTLNKLFGCRFNVDVKRCTDGLWMSVSYLKMNDEVKLIVLIDCERLFNVIRSIEEEVNLVLTSCSLSNITIFNTKNNFDDRNFIEFFERLHNISNKLKGSKLFKGDLLILIRDISKNNSDYNNTIDSFDKGLKNILSNNIKI